MSKNSDQNPEDFQAEHMYEYVEGQELDDEELLAKVVKFIGKVPFAREVMALFYATKDPAVPVTAKATIIAGLLYFVIPADAIPDVIPALGFTDDAAAIALALSMVSDVLTKSHYQEADDFFGNVEKNEEVEDQDEE